jgi:hypothetical protein
LQQRPEGGDFTEIHRQQQGLFVYKNKDLYQTCALLPGIQWWLDSVGGAP